MNWSDKSVAAPRNCLDKSGLARVIVQRFTKLGHCATQTGVADVRIFPKLIQQLVASDQPLRIANQIHKEREHGRLEVDRLSVAQQLPRAQIDAEWSKRVHGEILRLISPQRHRGSRDSL